jgi:alpha-D-ribose 1-methylphosphonate 5-triphosphate diphosphatase PhnM
MISRIFKDSDDLIDQAINNLHQRTEESQRILVELHDTKPGQSEWRDLHRYTRIHINQNAKLHSQE